MKSIVADRPAYLSVFFKDFYNVDVLYGDGISNDAIRLSWNVAVEDSAKGTLDCIPSWMTGFRSALPCINVPILIIQGAADRILPPKSTGARLPKLIKNSGLVVIPSGDATSTKLNSVTPGQ